MRPAKPLKPPLPLLLAHLSCHSLLRSPAEEASSSTPSAWRDSRKVCGETVQLRPGDGGGEFPQSTQSVGVAGATRREGPARQTQTSDVPCGCANTHCLRGPRSSPMTAPLRQSHLRKLRPVEARCPSQCPSAGPRLGWPRAPPIGYFPFTTESHPTGVTG